MKKQFVALFLLFATLVFPVSASTSDFKTLKISGIEGAIVPAETVQEWQDASQRRGAPTGTQNRFGVEAQGFWTPEAKGIEVVEARLRSAFEKTAGQSEASGSDAKTPSRQTHISRESAEILAHYSEYRRQYIGLVIHGKRHIFVNSFSAHEKLPYTTGFVVVFDGGFWFWNILYSVDDGTFSNLSINPSF